MKNNKNSSEFMETFDNAVEKLDTVEQEIKKAESVFLSRLSLFNYQQEYTSQVVNSLYHKLNQGAKTDKIVFAHTEKLGGIYDTYGITIHPAFIRTPNNILNFKSSTGPIFKNNMTVSVNGAEDKDFKYMLMHDDIAEKGICIKEYSSNNLTLDISLSKAGAIGDMKMNTIEILPYLFSSFDITKMEIYEKGSSSPAHRLTNLIDVGAARYILSEKVSLSRIVMNINLKYKNPRTNKYVFGLQHLYFLNADFNKDSYVVVRTERNKQIEYVYDNLLIGSQFGTASQTTATEMGIEFYLDYTNSQLMKKIETSTKELPSYISMNAKALFIKVPVTMPMISITPDIRIATN